MAQQTLTIRHKLGNLKFNPPDPHKEESANSTELPSDPHAHVACTHTKFLTYKNKNHWSLCHTVIRNWKILISTLGPSCKVRIMMPKR